MQNNLTVIIPSYNEESSIQETLERLLRTTKLHDWEILVINDGSTDHTADLCRKLQINVISHPHNKGYGAALKTGIRTAKTPLIAFYDADGQHNPEDLISLMEKFANYDMVVGARGKNSHKDWVRRPGKWFLGLVANYLTEKKIPDLNSGLRIIKRDIIISMLHLFPEGFSFSTTSTIAFMNMGYNVGYVPIIANKRVGKSSVKQLKHGYATILLIIRLIVLFNPLKVFMPFSLFMISWGIIWEVLFGIIYYPGVKLNPTAFLLLITGVLVFFFGLVVDQVAELRKHQVESNQYFFLK